MLVLDSIHQTLVTRRLELLTNHVATNASHPAIDRLLARMVIGLGLEGMRDSRAHVLPCTLDRPDSLVIVPVLTIMSLVELILQGGAGLYTVRPRSPERAPHPPKKKYKTSVTSKASKSPKVTRAATAAEDSNSLYDHNLAFAVLKDICERCSIPCASQAPPTLQWVFPEDSVKVHLQAIDVLKDHESHQDELQSMIEAARKSMARARATNQEKLSMYLDQIEAHFRARQD